MIQPLCTGITIATYCSYYVMIFLLSYSYVTITSQRIDFTLNTLNCRKTFKTIILCQLSDNWSFQSYLKLERRYASCEISELTNATFKAIHSFCFFNLRVRHTATYTIFLHMQVLHSEKYEPPKFCQQWEFKFFLTVAVIATKILSTFLQLSGLSKTHHPSH